MDSYTLVDGTVNTAPIHPMRGVKQGCPLSPLLFALFINDFTTERGININIPGPQRSSSNINISNIFYADDLLLTATKRESLQKMLNNLLLYSNSKGLKVNTRKSKVMIFNSRSEEQPFKYNGESLESVDQFKYLGLLIDKSANMKYADQQISKCYMAATRSHNKHLDFGVSKRIDLTIKLHATYARSAGMYASQIWSTPYIDPFSNASTYVESNHSSVMRFLLGVRRSTSRRSLLHEVGQMPFKFYWFRSVIKFWNDSIKSDNPLFRAVLLSDVSLA